MNPYFDPYEQPEQAPQQPQGYYHYTQYTLPSQQEPPVKKKKKGSKAIIAVALCCSFLGSILGAGGVLLADHWLESKQVPEVTEEEVQENLAILVEGQRESTVIQTVQLDTGKLLTPAEVYAANVASTVGITTSVTTNFWGYQTTSAASGSGFILSADGYILTNYHVIESSDSISVSLYDGRSFEAALIGYDESNDIAVLKIEGENLTPVILGDSDNLNVGDSVAAIGNPLGELTFSLTCGTISARDRQVTLSGNVTMNLLQTDCAINSGNSGGALFNMYGEVIGVTNAKYSGSSGSGASIDNIGFAIPINSIRSIVESIIEKGYISNPYIGIRVSDVSQQTQLYGIPAGVAVQEVSEGGPAESAGLMAGDIITAVNGTAMDSNTLIDFIGTCSVGDTITLSVYRQGQQLQLTVTVGERIQSALETEQPVRSPGGFGGRP